MKKGKKIRKKKKGRAVHGGEEKEKEKKKNGTFLRDLRLTGGRNSSE